MQEPGRPFPDSVRQLVDWHFAVEHGPQQLTRVASDSSGNLDCQIDLLRQGHHSMWLRSCMHAKY
jgi:hypothetical protein